MATIQRSTLTLDTLTDEQVETLRTESAATGDLLMVAICDIALIGEMARAEIVRVLLDADASAD